MHDRSHALALAQSGPRGRWRRDASKPRWLSQQRKTRCHSEPLPLSAGEQTHAQCVEGESGLECSQRTTRSVWKEKTRGSARGRKRRSREATSEGGQLVTTKTAWREEETKEQNQQQADKSKANSGRKGQSQQQGRLADESVRSVEGVRG